MSDKLVEQVNRQDPLISLSLFTSIQADTLKRIGLEILETTREWGEEGKPISEFPRAYDLIWLWTLGAYEVLRTMDQARDRFRSCKRSEITTLKQELAKIRMPFAKQELRSKGGPIYAENSIVDWRRGLVFEIDGDTINSTDVINETLAFLDGFTEEDILSALPVRRDREGP